MSDYAHESISEALTRKQREANNAYQTQRISENSSEQTRLLEEIRDSVKAGNCPHCGKQIV